MYECNWNISKVPNGALTISFDVYDKAGNRHLAPNGTRPGLIHRPQIPDGTLVQGTTKQLYVVYNDEAYRVPDHDTLDAIENRAKQTPVPWDDSQVAKFYQGQALPSVDMVQLDLLPSQTADSSAQLRNKQYVQIWLPSVNLATVAFEALNVYATYVLQPAECLAPEVPILAGTIAAAPESLGSSLAGGAWLTMLNFSVNPGCLGVVETVVQHATGEEGVYDVGG